MLIKNLPKPIKELVFKRQIEQGNQPNEELLLSDSKLLKNFCWGLTPERYTFWKETAKANYKPFFEKYGGVILCTSVEQGAKIIEYFKSLGVNTVLDCCPIGKYCGFGRGKFGIFSRDSVLHHGLPIFTLDELGVETTQELGWQGENTKHIQVTQGEKNTTVTFSLPTQHQQPELPEINFEGIEMELWDDIWDEDETVVYYKGKVIAKVNGRYLLDDWTFWDNARPIPQKVKITKEQITEAFNTTVELLEIEP